MKKNVSIFILILGCIGCQTSPQSPPSEKSTAIAVIAEKPTLRNITTYVDAIGRLEASQAFEIRPQVSGTIQKIFVTEGCWTKKGEPLFAIDSRIYVAQVEQAKAQLAIDSAAATAAQKKMERMRTLAERDLISQIEWEGVVATTDGAKALLKLDEARVAAAQLDLEHCLLTSLGDGKIGTIDLYLGALVSAAQATPLATITQLDPLVVSFCITEKDFLHFNAATTPVIVELLCSRSNVVEGKITFVDNFFNPLSGKLLIKATLPNRELCMHPGQSVRVRLPINFSPNRLIIPQKAVKYDSQGPYVYTVSDERTAIRRHLTLGEEIDDDVIVLEGIEASDQVITVGHLKLSPNLKVDVKS